MLQLCKLLIHIMLISLLETQPVLVLRIDHLPLRAYQYCHKAPLEVLNSAALCFRQPCCWLGYLLQMLRASTLLSMHELFKDHQY